MAAGERRVALVVGRFYEELGERLVAGARARLEQDGVGEIDVFDVPGAFELPLGELRRAQRALRRGGVPRRGHPRRDLAL